MYISAKNVSSQLKGRILRIMGIQECQHKGKYLGHPFCQVTTKADAYKEVMEKLANKLSGWRQKTLLMAGRLILVKVVATTIPSFAMQMVLLPKYMLDKIDKRIRDFLWGHKLEKAHHLPLKAWDSICSPKGEGGLGIKKMEDINLALVTKLSWQLATPNHKTWTELIKEKYLRGKQVLDA